MRSRRGGVFDAALLEQRPGFAVLRLSGKGVARLAETEPGGHRWQEPSGKKKAIHTSTVTVAVLPEMKQDRFKLDMKDVRIDCYIATGAGGQHRNKTSSAVRATHIPTGTVARSESERSQHINREYALAALSAKLNSSFREAQGRALAQERKAQVGMGERGDRHRTIRLQDGVVTDHRRGRKHQTRLYLKGDLEWLF